MTPDQALQQVRQMVNARGQSVAIRRYTGTGSTRTFVDTPTKAFVRNYGSNEIIGSIVYGDQKAVVLVDGLAAILPVTTNDKLVIGTKECAIKNPAKRVLSGVLIALDVQAAG